MENIIKKIIIISVVIGLLAGVTGCTGDDVLKRNNEEEVIQSNVIMDESNINALAAGQISEVLVEEGEKVKDGQELVILNSESLQEQKLAAEGNLESAKSNLSSVLAGTDSEQLEQLKLSVKMAESSLNAAEAAYKNAELNYNRSNELYKEGAISASDNEQIYTSLENAKASYEKAQYSYKVSQSQLQDAVNGADQETIEQAQAAVKTAQASVDQLQISIDNCTLKSPVDGLVTLINVKKGDMVSSGLTTVVVTDISHPYILCNVDETELGKVKINQDVKIQIATSDDEFYQGTITRINKAADFATKKASNVDSFDVLSYGIKVSFNNNELTKLQEKLYAGMTAFVYLREDM